MAGSGPASPHRLIIHATTERLVEIKELLERLIADPQDNSDTPVCFGSQTVVIRTVTARGASSDSLAAGGGGGGAPAVEATTEGPRVKKRSGNHKIQENPFNLRMFALKSHYDELRAKFCGGVANGPGGIVQSDVLVGNRTVFFSRFNKDYLAKSTADVTYYMSDPPPTRFDKDGQDWAADYFGTVMSIRPPRDRAAEKERRKKAKMADGAPSASITMCTGATFSE
jgi:hypothetical protein